MRKRGAVPCVLVAALAAVTAAVTAAPRASRPAPPAPTAPAPATATPAPGERSTRHLLQAGSLAIEEGSYQAAESRFHEAADIDPRLTQAWFGMALAAIGRRDHRGAEKALRTAQDLAPGHPEVLYATGVVEFAWGDPRDAEAALHAAADADRRLVEARYAVGIAAAARGDLPAAESALREALKLDGLHAFARYQLGAVLARRGDLDGSVGELSRALAREPALRESQPDDPFVFAGRDVAPAAAGATLGLPLPVLRPSLAYARRRPGPATAASVATDIPDWFLDYHMSLELEDAGQWSAAVDTMQRALALKDRSEGLAVVAGRLVDYSPHLHLATDFHHLGNFREAFLHLNIAKNEGNASPDALRALSVLVQKDRLRPRIYLDPLPDRTSDEAITVRGVVVADEAVQRVEVSGREATLRTAAAGEVAERLPDSEKASVREGVQGVIFEISNQKLWEGTNLIAVRPFFRNPARDGDLLEASVVRVPAPAAAPAKAEPPKPPPAKPGAHKPAPKPSTPSKPSTPPAPIPKPPANSGAPAPGGTP
ncbi:MAG TPA: tetratricopeptide repeat protein [Patescibacteria group bacterium]|nr:tetratricopeptide repeat protein [Patescibacteria group bacterium]